MSSSLNHITDDLLVKFLSGETTPEEDIKVEKWIDLTNSNKRYFADFKFIWDKSREIEQVSTVNENEAWMRFKNKVNQAQNNRPAVYAVQKDFYWLRIAAVLFVLVFGTWLAITLLEDSKEQKEFFVKVETKKNILVDTLPDGSVVTLNKDSEYLYPETFNGKERKIVLKGEAFFNITPDKENPFIISVNDIIVKVIGTSFNIKSSMGKTEVIVETGVVEVERNNKNLLLLPKEKVTVLQNDPAFEKENSEDNLYNYFRTGEFVCDNTPLWKVVETLNEAYNARIIIERKGLGNELLTTTFNNESLDRILVIIAETFSITIVKKDNQIILK